MTRYIVGSNNRLFGLSDETTYMIDKYFKRENFTLQPEKLDIGFLIRVTSENLEVISPELTRPIIDIYKPLEQRILEKELKL